MLFPRMIKPQESIPFTLNASIKHIYPCVKNALTHCVFICLFVCVSQHTPLFLFSFEPFENWCNGTYHYFIFHFCFFQFKSSKKRTYSEFLHLLTYSALNKIYKYKGKNWMWYRWFLVCLTFGTFWKEIDKNDRVKKNITSENFCELQITYGELCVYSFLFAVVIFNLWLFLSFFFISNIKWKAIKFTASICIYFMEFSYSI